MKLELQKPQHFTDNQVQWCKIDSRISEHWSGFALHPYSRRQGHHSISWLTAKQLRAQIKAWICFQKILLGTALSKGWCLTFQWESQEVMCPRATPQGPHLNTLFPHCFKGVIIYYSISSIAHHLVACLMWRLGCFPSMFSVCLRALSGLWMLPQKVARTQKEIKLCMR